MTVPEEALRELTALSGVVLMQTDLPATLIEICNIAVRAVPGVEGASITTFPEGRPGAVASDPWAQELDELQFGEHEGPCLDAFRTGNLFRVRDLANEPRWPSYVPRIVEKGARSLMSLPMSAQGKVIGALNLYARTPDAFDSDAVSLAEIAAGHAGLASEVSAAFFRHRDLAEQFAAAMKSRAVIEQAKGIVMASRHCDAEEAFAYLVSASQHSHRKLRDITQDLVASIVDRGASRSAV